MTQLCVAGYNRDGPGFIPVPARSAPPHAGAPPAREAGTPGTGDRPGHHGGEGTALTSTDGNHEKTLGLS
ncbi:MAG: hypothetical protein MOP51_2140 [Citricoccus sp.]|nr:hypothetical protein [Citricoccus sp. WCRC_4]